MKHVIIGNGPAGVVAAELLRKRGPGDDILLIGDEREPPYSRMAIPYLLIGDIDEAGTYLGKDPDHFGKLAIALASDHVRGVNTSAREVHLESGKRLTYDRLLIAPGVTPNRPSIPG